MLIFCFRSLQIKPNPIENSSIQIPITKQTTLMLEVFNQTILNSIWFNYSSLQMALRGKITSHFYHISLYTIYIYHYNCYLHNLCRISSWKNSKWNIISCMHMKSKIIMDSNYLTIPIFNPNHTFTTRSSIFSSKQVK